MLTNDKVFDKIEIIGFFLSYAFCCFNFVGIVSVQNPEGLVSFPLDVFLKFDVTVFLGIDSGEWVGLPDCDVVVGLKIFSLDWNRIGL